MYTFLIMFILCLAAQRAHGKSLFEYNVNPEYDLLADEPISYSNFLPSSEISSPTQRRFKHYANPGRGYGNTAFGGHSSTAFAAHPAPAFGGHSSPDFDFSDHTHFHHSSEECDHFSDLSYGYPSHFAEHPAFPPGQAKKHGFTGFPPGQAKKHGFSGSPQDPPRRFPPPPVYDKDFINPWSIPSTTPEPFVVQKLPETTPGVYLAPKLTTPKTTPAVYLAPKLTTPKPTKTTPAVYIAPKLTTPRTSVTATTPSPITSTTSDDQSMFDIDVRFGRD